MNKKNDGYKGAIISAAIGGMFFAIPYLALDASILISLGIGAAAFGAGNLIFTDKNKEIVVEELDSNKTTYDILKDAKSQNSEIYFMIDKVESKKLKEDIREIHDTATKIIDTVSKNPKKLNKANTFFNYYLPVTLKILQKYDTIENQRLEDTESKRFMESTEKMVEKIKNSFKAQLSNLYQSEIIDTDAEIKVFENMLKSDGFDDSNDFNLK